MDLGKVHNGESALDIRLYLLFALLIHAVPFIERNHEGKEKIKSDIQRRFPFVNFAKIHFISALHGTGVGDIYPSIHRAYESARKTLTTNVLTQILQDAVTDHAPPIINGRRIKLRYAHAGGQNPPIIVIHGKQTDIDGIVLLVIKRHLSQGLYLIVWQLLATYCEKVPHQYT